MPTSSETTNWFGKVERTNPNVFPCAPFPESAVFQKRRKLPPDSNMSSVVGRFPLAFFLPQLSRAEQNYMYWKISKGQQRITGQHMWLSHHRWEETTMSSLSLPSANIRPPRDLSIGDSSRHCSRFDGFALSHQDHALSRNDDRMSACVRLHVGACRYQETFPGFPEWAPCTPPC